MIFSFVTDNKSHDYCTRIVILIKAMYGLDESEAISLVNKTWSNADLREVRTSPEEILGYMTESDLLYHEMEHVWASTIANPCPYLQGADFEEWNAREKSAQSRLPALL